MALSDPRFLLFLAAAALCLGAAASAYRRWLLLFFSCVFLVLLGPNWYVPFVVAGCGYLGGLALGRLTDGTTRDGAFVTILLMVLTPLLLYKYLPSFPVVSQLQSPSAFILPIGLSFYSFTTVGYLIDVYVGKIVPERRLLSFLNFVLFFPNFSVGPIERSAHLIPQLETVGTFDYRRSVSGLQCILLGYFYKVVVADSLAPHVETLYGNHLSHGSIDVILGTVYFAFQVYADFAGYSLIAIGSARLLGIELLPNFRQPYLSMTVAEFWRRWHISLSSWFRDYVFTPLHFQLRRRGRVGMSIALISSFLLVGLWHGAGLQFILFGLIHGVLVTVSTFTLAARNSLWARVGISPRVISAARIAITFSIVCCTLVLFRAADLSEAISVYRQVLDYDQERTLPIRIPALLIASLLLCDWFAYSGRSLYDMGVQLRWVLYYSALLVIFGVAILHLSQGTSYEQQFIYFRF
ncbi:MAG: hypothetical protein KL839_04880 [Rhizobium sp.]|nr:hypothetical protein [Rhizobium sp.]